MGPTGEGGGRATGPRAGGRVRLLPPTPTLKALTPFSELLVWLLPLTSSHSLNIIVSSFIVVRAIIISIEKVKTNSSGGTATSATQLCFCLRAAPGGRVGGGGGQRKRQAELKAIFLVFPWIIEIFC